MKKTKLFILLLTTFQLISCTKQEGNKKQIHVYFELKNYFDSEAHRLKKSNITINKTITKDGVSETKKISNIDWENEFSVFKASDINKPAWAKSYKIERKLEGSDSTEIYTALDSALHTRSLKVSWNQNQVVQKILIVNSTRNGLYSLDETLQYIPNEMYKIDRIQKAKLLEENKFDVTGLFVKN